MSGQHFDVIVVGGGPSGSSTAALLAKEGRKVLLLEREKFPRYHIGESLIPGMWPTIEQLGLRERLENSGFVKKYGGSLVWGRGLPLWHFDFAEGGPYPYTFQVRRADFDMLLLTRARELGVRVVEDATVKNPLFTDERMTGVSYQVRGGPLTEAHARLVVDASGQQRWLGRHFDMVEWQEDLRNFAVWAYFQGCAREEGERRGNILAERRPGGWIWFIPFSDGTTGVGYVTPTRLLAESGLSPENLFEEQVAASQQVSKMVAGAHRVSGFRTIKDWSYTCSRFHGPGWLLVGDAATFVDPLLSTGVTLALRGATTAAATIGRILDEPADAAKAGAQYEDAYRRFVDRLFGFVRAFYDQTKGRDEYFDDAQKIMGGARKSPQADFVTLVSGLAGIEEFYEGGAFV